ncbi:unnamed protein product [Prorocentrum cordatum]|uniref:Uncharacterized protein n=1 Tax=Prorocentrum cordatum TaxID=2364126 RepID=A0ABN9T0N7_9DINO|nr:unnamed protein product [Polarella glacialis]
MRGCLAALSPSAFITEHGSPRAPRDYRAARDRGPAGACRGRPGGLRGRRGGRRRRLAPVPRGPAHRQSKADVQEVFPQCKIALQACGCLGATDTSVIQPTEAMSTFGPGVNTTVFKFTCTDSVNSSCLVYSPPGPKMHCLALDSCDGGQVAPYNMNCVVLNRGSMKFTCCSDSTPGWQSCPSCNGNPFR